MPIYKPCSSFLPVDDYSEIVYFYPLWHAKALWLKSALMASFWLCWQVSLLMP